MQTKDIPDRPILEFLLKHKGHWCCAGGTNGTNVFIAMPDNTPWRLGLSKMRSLIRRGLVDGCGCGCRGDFEITKKGEEFMSS